MKCDKKMMLVYAVTDRTWEGDLSLEQQVEEALKNGATCIQLREKELGYEAFLREAKKIGALCKQYGVPFIINDNIEIAVESNADGVHVGQDDMAVADVRRLVGSQMIIGVSAHTVEEALEAEKNGADYLGVGSVFSTSTKKNVNTMSFDMLKSICAAVRIPVVAIGGISSKNIMQLQGSGIDGVAVVSAIFGAQNPGLATAELVEIAKKITAK